MAWVRRVRTASGATAVQIAESVNGRGRIVRHVGSAHDEAELGLLLEEAHRLLEDERQGVLDLGMTPALRKTAMVAPPTPEGLLFEPADRSAGAGPGPLVPRSRVLKTSSELVYEALAGVYSSLGFDVVSDEVFRDLVIARIVQPTSLLDIDRVLAEMGRASVSLSTRKRTLRRCRVGTYRDQIATACFNYAVTSGDVSLVLYDVTTLYFETENQDDLRKVGFSKERRANQHHPASQPQASHHKHIQALQIVRSLRVARSATIELNGQQLTLNPELSTSAQEILSHLKKGH